MKDNWVGTMSEGKKRHEGCGNTLAVQQLRLTAFTAEDSGSIPGRGTKIPQAGPCNQKSLKNDMRGVRLSEKVAKTIKLEVPVGLMNHRCQDIRGSEVELE